MRRFDFSPQKRAMTQGIPGGAAMNNPLGKNSGDVWQINTEPFKGSHFAVFPLKLVIPMILSSCPRGGVVMDVFGGSGTVGEAVSLLNIRNRGLNNEEIRNMRRNLKNVAPLSYEAARKWITVDLNLKYCEIALKRLSPYCDTEVLKV